MICFARKIYIPLFLLFSSFQLVAQKNALFLKFGTGISALSFNENQRTRQQGCFTMAFAGGYNPTDWLRLGIDLNGYLLEPYGNFNSSPDKGESISCINLFTEWCPFKKRRLYFIGEGGFSRYTNMHTDGYSSRGWAFKPGMGYALALPKNMLMAFQVAYCVGGFKNVVYPGISFTRRRFNAVEFTLTLYFVKVIKKREAGRS